MDDKELSVEALLKLFENDEVSVDDVALMESVAGPMEKVEARLPKALLKALNDVSDHEELSSQLRAALFHYLSENHEEALQDASETIEPDTQIRTDSGLQDVRDLQMSQKLHGLVTQEVQAVHPAGTDKALTIETDGDTIELADNHELLVKGGGVLAISLKPAAELQSGDRLIRAAHVRQIFPGDADKNDCDLQ